ncbi:MAG: Nramp family divalent metal transporter [Salinirussus sp.]
MSGSTADRSVMDRLRAVGPALVLAAVVVGPGSIALSTIAGSLYGYQLLWVPVAATIFMITYTWMAARIGLVTGETIFGATRQKYGDTVAKAGGILAFLTILSFQAGNNAAMGFASEALFDTLSPQNWAIIFTAVAIIFLWAPDLYDKVELLVKIVVGIMIVGFVGTLVLVGVDVGAAAGGLVPTFPDTDAILLALGLAATNFSIAAAVYQTNLMNEKEWGPDKLADEGMDTLIGIGILGLIVIVIMLTSAGVIYGQTDPVFSAQGMAEQLRPLVGPAAFYLFTIGFFFATLSSLFVNALIGATLLIDGFDRDARMDSRQVKYWTMAAMILGLLAVILSGGSSSPIELLRLAQAIAVVAFPLLAFIVLDIARDSDMMGEYANPTAVNVIGVLGYITVIAIIINYLNEVLAYFGYGIF